MYQLLEVLLVRGFVEAVHQNVELVQTKEQLANVAKN